MSQMATEGAPCTLWGGRLDRDGYGRYGRKLAHRIAWADAFGAIPEGMTVDHTCFTRACVNPEHLRLLTASENCSLRASTLRTHCRHGHEFTPENTYFRSKRHRCCRRCNLAAVKRYEAKKKAARA